METEHILVIEELNRVNAAAMFAEAFQLLDRDDDGWSQYPTDLGLDVLGFCSDFLTFSSTPQGCSSLALIFGALALKSWVLALISWALALNSLALARLFWALALKVGGSSKVGGFSPPLCV